MDNEKSDSKKKTNKELIDEVLRAFGLKIVENNKREPEEFYDIFEGEH